MQNIRRILLITLTYIGISGCVHFYSHNSIELRAIDAETKQPIEDVIAVAHWSLSRGSIGGNVEVGVLQVMEAVSDFEGKIYFQEWGPITTFNGYLDYRGAQIMFFKDGYNLFSTENPDTTWRAKHPEESQWNGKTVQLKRFKKPFSEYVRHVERYIMDLDKFRYGDNCEWKKIPLILVEIHKLRDKFKKQKIVNPTNVGLGLKKVTKVYNTKECGSPEEFFGKYITLQKSNDNSSQQVETRFLRPSMTFEDATPIQK